MEVPAVHLDELLPRKPSQPGIERKGTVSEVLGKLAGGLRQDFLNHVRRIDPWSNSGVHSNVDHLAKSISMQVQEFV